MNCEIFKLVNGDEVISEFEEKDGKIIFKNPAKIITGPTEDGEIGMALIPWCMYSEEKEFEIDAAHVITSVDAPNGLYNNYNKHFGPGIVDPTKQDLIL